MHTSNPRSRAKTKHIHIRQPIARASYERVPRATPITPSTYVPLTRERGRPNPLPQNVVVIDDDCKSNDTDPPQHQCPVCKRRITMGSVKRHIQTHKRIEDDNAGRGWRCKGVPVTYSSVYGVPASSRTYKHRNSLRVGGCMKTFSRRDALRRHITNNERCFGHANREDTE